MRVVCDTNIWYKFHTHPSLLNNLDGAKLVLTFNTLNEFAQSINLLKKPIFYKNVAKSIVDNHHEAILHNPFHHIKSIDDNEWQPDSKLGHQLLKNVVKLVDIPDKEIIEFIKKNYGQLENKISEGHAGLDKSTDDFNTIIDEIRSEVKTLPKKEYRQLNLTNDNQMLVSYMVEENTQSNISIDFDWSEIELFTSVMDCYFKDLALQSGSKIAYNDWIDLFNLVYVNSGMKYWTCEKKWIRIVDESIGSLSSYLYKPQSVS